MKDQILYLFDPLCGWCYGFSDTLLSFYQAKKDQYDFVTIPGGMVTGARVGPISQMEDYINKSYPQVEKMTGIKFGESYTEGLLRSKNTELNSEPPSRALIAFREFYPGRSVEFAHALQHSHYHEGNDYNDESVYESLARSFDIDVKAFVEHYHHTETKQKVQEAFKWVKAAGIQGFPSLVLHSGENYYMLSHGYSDQPTLESTLKKAQEMANN